MEQVFAGRRFSQDEARALIVSMIDGTLSDLRVAAVLTGFRFLELSEDIIMTLLKALKKNQEHSFVSDFSHIVDCGGTGGDFTSTVNISTYSAIVAASCGVNIAKFAGKAVSSKAGSSELLHMLAITPVNSVSKIYKDLKKFHISFLLSQTFYPELKRLMEIRKVLGFKTVIDIIFPLVSPVPLTGQLVGVYHKNLLSLLINCLKMLGRRRAMTVFGEQGLDEISVSSGTWLSRLENNKITQEFLKPADFGMPCHDMINLQGKGAEYNVKVLEDLLNQRAHCAVFDAVTLNAAAILWCAEKCHHLGEGLKIAQNAIRSGAALKNLEKWKLKRR